jgi:glycosyltransferase involved in cell wall biosynthesis
MLLLTLNTFSRTGGIQQFNRCLQLALCNYAAERGEKLVHLSLLDEPGKHDPQYGSGEHLTCRGFSNKKPAFILAAMAAVSASHTVIFGHVNLSPLALLPGFAGKRCIMVAHGVEVWEKLPFLKKKGLGKMEAVWAVSQYTADKLAAVQGFPASRIHYFPNTLDPFFAKTPLLPSSEWNRHWRINPKGNYLLTVARLSHTEVAKGYDEVIRALPSLSLKFPDITYILAGKADDAEYTRIRNLADQLGVGSRLLMPGFVPEKWLPSLYHLAGVFVLPSTKEGFGIVFLEAAWCGCAVVAYHSGGAPEALFDGQIGTLVPPGNPQSLADAISQSLLHPANRQEILSFNQSLISSRFGFSQFCSRLSDVLSEK